MRAESMGCAWNIRGLQRASGAAMLSYRETGSNLSPGIPWTGNWVNAEQARSTEEVKPND